MSHATRAARLRLTAALTTLRIARTDVRGVYWSECTSEAEPLRRLSRESAARLEDVCAKLNQTARLRPEERRRELPPLLATLESAWRDTHAALDGWSGVPSQLAPGDTALDCVRNAVEELCGGGYLVPVPRA